MAGSLYDYFIGKVVPPLPYPKAEQFTDSVDILATQNPNVKSVDLNKMIDMSFVKSAEDRGVHKK